MEMELSDKNIKELRHLRNALSQIKTQAENCLSFLEKFEQNALKKVPTSRGKTSAKEIREEKYKKKLLRN